MGVSKSKCPRPPKSTDIKFFMGSTKTTRKYKLLILKHSYQECEITRSLRRPECIDLG